MAILAGLASAVGYGTSDFGGGLASRRSDPYSVVLVSQVTGMALLLWLLVANPEPLPATYDLLAAAAAGAMGTIALVNFYRELAKGRMGVIAPATAVVTVTVPVLFSAVTEGLPQMNQVAGIVLALLAIWLITRSGNHQPATGRDLVMILMMGFFFSLFLVTIGTLSERSIIWPLIASRTASIAIVAAVIMLTRRKAVDIAGRQLPLMVFIGFLDVGGSAFYALATTLGRLDIAAVLASLYPAVTVLLARVVLAEVISGRQWFGISAALAAIVLITI